MKSSTYGLKAVPMALSVALFNSVQAHGSGTIGLGTVTTTGTDVGHVANRGEFESKRLTTKQKLKSTEAVKTVAKKMVQLFGPDAGGMQALSILPNVSINSYNASSVSSRSTISMRGIKVGYNSIPGDLETNGITVALDGIPLNSLSQGTGWHSPEVPIGALMEGTNVIQGPGNPDQRWYDSLGGTINFIPIQPSGRAHSTLSVSGGSFNTLVVSGIHDFGKVNGWSSVLGIAHAGSQSIRNTPGSLPSHTTQLYGKARKSLENGSLSVGVYALHNDEWRPNMIPVSANSEIHLDGLSGAGPLYSEQTTGFYSTLPKSVWFKHNFVKDYMTWARLRLDLSSNLKMVNSFWFRNGNIFHYRQNHYIQPLSTTYLEDYHEHSYNFGDKLAFHKQLSRSNTLSFGGWWINARARSNYLGYAPDLGYHSSNPAAVYFNTTFSTYWATFLQDRLQLPGAVTVVPGVSLNGFQTDFVNTSPTEVGTLYPGGVPAYLQGNYDTNPNQSSYFFRAEPSLGVNWRITRNLAAFAHYGVAYHNPSSGNYDNYPLDINALKPVKSTNYDVGVRAIAHDAMGIHKLTASVDYFHTSLTDQTIPRSIAGSPITTFGYGAATLKGVDLELAARLNNSWSGFANFGYLNSNWDSFYSTTTNQYYDGYPVSNSPKETFNAGVTYRRFLADSVVSTTLWDQYFGHRYLWDNNNGAPTNQTIPAYNLLNLSVVGKTAALNGLVPGVELTTISLTAQNLLNKQYNSTAYISSGGYFGTNSSGYIIANPGAPRSVYLSLTMDF